MSRSTSRSQGGLQAIHSHPLKNRPPEPKPRTRGYPPWGSNTCHQNFLPNSIQQFSAPATFCLKVINHHPSRRQRPTPERPGLSFACPYPDRSRSSGPAPACQSIGFSGPKGKPSGRDFYPLVNIICMEIFLKFSKRMPPGSERQL